MNHCLFLQTDPIPGGSANAYDYANQDAVNNYDLTGDCWFCDVLGGELAVALPDEWNPVGWVTDVVIVGTVAVGGVYYTYKGGVAIAHMAEHKKNKRPSSESKHQKGRTRQ